MRLKRLLARVLLTVMLAGCGTATKPATDQGAKQTSSSASAQNAPQKPPIKIGVVAPYSGSQAELGEYIKWGVETALAKINAAGGVNGHPLQTVYRDDEANPTKSEKAIQDLLFNEGIVALIGPGSSTTALATLATIMENKLPTINPMATLGNFMDKAYEVAGQRPNYVFRTTSSTRGQAQRIVKYLVDKGYKRVALFYDSSSYGKSGYADLMAEMQKVGIKPVTEQTFNIGVADLTPQVAQAKAAGADIIVSYTYGAENARITLAKQKLGWDVPIIGGTGITMKIYRELTGTAGNGTLSVWLRNTHVPPKNGQGNTKIAEAFKEFQKLFPDKKLADVQDWVSSPWSYDAVMILVSALKRAGTDPVNREKLREAIEGTHTEGLITKDRVTFTKDNHEMWSGSDYAIIETRDNKMYQIED